MTKIADIIPKAGHVQRLHCDSCKSSLDLEYTDFCDRISEIDIIITGLPVLRCAKCGREHLPDRSRLAIVDVHTRAAKAGAPSVQVTRQKIKENFGFTNVPFLYDADDYHYIPGLRRPFEPGFLTPVFFNRSVLLKYDSSPGYRLIFASRTYGEIVSASSSISFGINRNGKVVMWLGDIAQLPEAEQYYLRSENVPSDHSIGGEFYDGQIECVFTEPTEESRLIALRSQFVEACLKRFGTQIAHLSQEVVQLTLELNAPVVDTQKERRHVADTLNKIHIEALDNGALGRLLIAAGHDPKGLGSLKRLQMLLELEQTGDDVATVLSPFFILYDLRVAYSHLGSEEIMIELIRKVTSRLGLSGTADLSEIYSALISALSDSYGRLLLVVDPGHEPKL